jgi:hypothetical protein
MSPADRERRHAAFATWCERHADRLAALHPDVATEIRSVTLSRILAGTHRAMTAQEIDECRARVASRLRIKRYRALPSDDAEARRQLEECRAECGLINEKPPVNGHVPAQAAE